MFVNHNAKRDSDEVLQSDKAFKTFSGVIILLCMLTGIFLMLVRNLNRPDDGWQKAMPQEVNMNEVILQDLVTKMHNGLFGNFDGLVIIKDNKLVIDEYKNGYNADRIHTVQSVTKSITSLLVGIAIDHSEIHNEEVKILDYFQINTVENLDEMKRAITIRDLLTMQGGFHWDEFSTPINEDNPVVKMNNSPNWVKCAIDAPMSYKPGTKFQYNSGGVMLLDHIIHKETGMHADKYAEKQLFSRLGIRNYYWSKQHIFFGTTHTGGGLYLRPRDLAKIGQLILNKGRWEGEQIVSEEWISKSLEKHVESVPLGILRAGYGYLWWIFPDKSAQNLDIYACMGSGGQYMFIIPQHNLIVVTAGNEFDDRYTGINGALVMLNDYILKSLH